MSNIEPTRPATALDRALARTPARLMIGRTGPAYRTETWLRLRADHAAARDAVHADLDLDRDFGPDRVARFELFEVTTQARTRAEYLSRPGLGRRLCEPSRDLILTRCPPGRDLQVIIGDGLSATAAATQAPLLLDLLRQESAGRGWTFGRPFLVQNCRVGILNDIGDLLGPRVVVLLIGERPGLATAESLSAYLAYRPHAGHTDADRNLVSNIHPAGVPPPAAAGRIAEYAARLMAEKSSGFAVKERAAGSLRPNPDE